MSYPLYAVTIHVEVTDPEALHEDAMARAMEEGIPNADELLRDDAGDIDVGACLQMLFDPGVSPAGAEIQSGSTELLHDPEATWEDEGEDAADAKAEHYRHG